MKEIKIFDTTLRDGEQSAGVSLNVKEKLAIGRQLAKLNVDCIEAGFPIASPGDFEAVKAVAEHIRGPVIAGLARANEKDIKRAWDALQATEKPRIHTFIATSPIHMKHKLQKTASQVLADAVAGVKFARSFTGDVEFSAEDAFRSELPFLYEIFEAVIAAGATTINIPDTVGYAFPQEFGAFIASIKKNVPNIDNAVISVHCHNDLGLAVANSLAAIENGAQQVEVTVNGIGERAGNASLEELVMAMHTKRKTVDADTAVATKEIFRTCRMVSQLTGIPIAPNKAIVGSNAFAHESGIHQDGMLKEKTTYEIMNPEMIGIENVESLVLGKHSGRHAFRIRLQELGFELEDDALVNAFRRFKELADVKKEILDEDLIALVDSELLRAEEAYHLDYMQVTSGTSILPTATVIITTVDGRRIKHAALAKGPIEAAYQAINDVINEDIVLEDYGISSVTKGRDALGEVKVRISYKGRMFTGRGVSVDIIESSALAYIDAVNRAVYLTKQIEKQTEEEGEQ